MKPSKKSITKANKDIDNAMDLNNAACAGDCTGLIQTPPSNRDEIENYQSICSFRASSATKTKDPHK